MPAGTLIQHKRKAGAFIGGELAAGEFGVDTTTGNLYISTDGSTVILATPSPDVVQIKCNASKTTVTGTTSIPRDDTIPLISEGFEILTETIVPRFAENDLIVDAVINVTAAAATWATMAIFRDGGACAGATYEYISAQATSTLALKIKVAAGSTLPTTFAVRLGPNLGVSLSVNNASVFADCLTSSLQISEVKP